MVGFEIIVQHHRVGFEIIENSLIAWALLLLTYIKHFQQRAEWHT